MLEAATHNFDFKERIVNFKMQNFFLFFFQFLGGYDPIKKFEIKNIKSTSVSILFILFIIHIFF